MYFESLNTKKITDNRTWKTVVPLFTSMALRGEKIILKGYLRYKTRTSQNVSFEAQVKNSQKSYVPFSRYSSFCIFNNPKICKICDVMMSIST